MKLSGHETAAQLPSLSSCQASKDAAPLMLSTLHVQGAIIVDGIGNDIVVKKCCELRDQI